LLKTRQGHDFVLDQGNYFTTYSKHRILLRGLRIRHLPFRRATLFRGLEGWGDVLADPSALRKAYRTEFARFLTTLRRACHEQRFDYALLRTDRPIDAALSQFLAARGRSTR
jgi:hypothetical protein